MKKKRKRQPRERQVWRQAPLLNDYSSLGNVRLLATKSGKNKGKRNNNVQVKKLLYQERKKKGELSFIQTENMNAYLQQYPRNDSMNDNPPPPFEADPSGIVKRDLTDEIIDRRDLYQPHFHASASFATQTTTNKNNNNSLIPKFGQDNENQWEPPTPLGQEIIQLIQVTGRPMTVAEFMRLALSHATHGYYTNQDHNSTTTEEEEEEMEKKDKDDGDYQSYYQSLTDEEKQAMIQGSSSSFEDDENDDENKEETQSTEKKSKIIGRRGDFITAPEISQVFGEACATWHFMQYQQNQNHSSKKRIQLVELGPGRGTLMADMVRFLLRAGASINNNTATPLVGAIHLVEKSPYFRQEQHETLQTLFQQQDPAIKVKFHPIQEKQSWETMRKKQTKSTNNMDSKQTQETLLASEDDGDNKDDNDHTIHVYWHESFTGVLQKAPNLNTPIYITCQEFIDALPIHAFEKTPDGWRERMVDIATNNENDDDDDDTIQKPQNDDNDKKSKTTTTESTTNHHPKPRLRVVLSKGATPATTLLLNVNQDGQEQVIENNDEPKTHDESFEKQDSNLVCEVCPEGILLAQDMARLLSQCGGAALVIDYGESGGSRDSIRGFSHHEQVNFLSRPGRVDVTADVDFDALVHAVNRHQQFKTQQQNNSHHHQAVHPRAFGPITQGHFLIQMGAVERTEALIVDDNTTEEQANHLYNGLETLVDPKQMGQRYKVMAITTGPTSEGGSVSVPPGFETQAT